MALSSAEATVTFMEEQIDFWVAAAKSERWSRRCVGFYGHRPITASRILTNPATILSDADISQD